MSSFVKSRFNRPSSVVSPMGSGIRSIFQERLENGKRQLCVVGKENFKEYIEASKNETLISNIIKRFESGDLSVLSRTQGFYGDVTSMPTNLAEAQNLLIKLESDFNNLPVDVRAKYNHSFDEYVKEISSGTVEDFMRNVYGVDSNNHSDNTLPVEKSDKLDGDINE